ncbi:MAG TPA: LuxR C-terminal-related transcriptional regulator [Chitinophagaceae bacterium]|nr:LuxR C-terminal-related transcriptional regulator [Chitinophagaceae bacterium]
MPLAKSYSYQQYLDLIADSSGKKMQEESSLIIDRFSVSQDIPSRFAPVTFLVDFATKKYIYVDEACFNLFGYTAGWMMEYGLGEYLKTWHPADYDIINEKVFIDNIDFLKTLPKEKYADIVFSYNYRVLNPKGEYVTLLQRFSYIPGETPGFPLGMVGVAFNITHFKNDLSIVHTIEESRQLDNGIIDEILFKKIHPIPESGDLQPISRREIEILKHMAAGFSSKQIADNLNISINTINNHRKSMLSKTRCNSSAELMNYAVKHGLL